MSPLLAVLLYCLPGADPAVQPVKPFTITVVDEETGRGVPLVELQTVNHLRYFTDSNGVVAFREPDLMGQSVYFDVRTRGQRCDPQPGELGTGFDEDSRAFQTF